MKLFLLAQAAATAQVPASPPVPPPPVTEWPALPLFPLPRTAAVKDASAYVRAEVDAGRCRAALMGQQGTHLVAPVVILVGPGGGVRRIVPRAIGCPTVEQYTVGYLLSLTRAGPGPSAPLTPGWYRLAVTYRW